MRSVIGRWLLCERQSQSNKVEAEPEAELTIAWSSRGHANTFLYLHMDCTLPF